ncbi:DUF2382 domain-containing protein [Kineococcus aurantiacus]|uniref:DUF2382 domain-containing protein n=1 Tax=Kineococcus aurantiacus TaxID=37633 RepID=A0A7Y9DM56_9ACTN|nr:hypothetical protein [Kineococcus aurantiacus]
MSQQPTGPTTDQTIDQIASGRAVDRAAEVVLSAEVLSTGTVRVPVERVRVAKRIVHTTRTIEVPVRVEELVVTREAVEATADPATDLVADPADLLADPGDLVADPATEPVPGAGPTEVVLVLHEEVPQVSLRVEPVEVVRVEVQRVTGETVLEAELRTEVADVVLEETEHPGRP